MSKKIIKGEVVALIPARGGSKGIPRKNIKMIGGKPLLAHTVAFAKENSDIDRIIVSTDSEEIAEIALEYGAEVPFIRPANLASDTAPMYETVKHLMEYLSQSGFNYQYLALLQPTSPFRRHADFKAALKQIRNHVTIDSVVSLEKLPNHLSPEFLMRLEDGVVKPFIQGNLGVSRRQDATPAYTRSGQFYISKISSFSEKNTIYGDRSVPYVTSHQSVNLDTMDDWDAAVALMESI